MGCYPIAEPQLIFYREGDASVTSLGPAVAQVLQRGNGYFAHMLIASFSLD